MPKPESADSALLPPKAHPRADRKGQEAMANSAAKQAKFKETFFVFKVIFVKMTFPPMFLSVESILVKMDLLHGTGGSKCNRDADEAGSSKRIGDLKEEAQSSSGPVKFC